MTINKHVHLLCKVICATLIGIMTSYLIHCGTETLEKIKSDSIGEEEGSFSVRLSSAFRDKVDQVKSALNSIVPNTDFTARFSGDDDALSLTGDSKLSDLFKVKVPDTGVSFINKEIFSSLKSLASGDNKYFEAVDTNKFIPSAAMNYDPAAVTDPKKEKQYYLSMIDWDTAIKTYVTDDLLANAAPIVVAVLDTGVWSEHEDLKEVMWKDPDTNKVTGYDAINESETNTPSDDHGHGTHVAGIIGAQGNNNLGIHGIGFLPRSNGQSITEIMSVRVLNSEGAGSSEYVENGIRWAVKKHNTQKLKSGREKQHLILNLSLGGPFEVDGYDYEKDSEGNPILKNDLIDYAANNGALVLVAAGNESCKISGSCKVFGRTFTKTYYFPCSYSNVLCVGATTNQDKLAGFSNRYASVGITAPGWQILSTVPSSLSQTTYTYFNGTSQATPVTAGAAAIIWSLYPDFTANDIKQIIVKSSRHIDSITQEFITNAGRLDLNAALKYAAELKAAGKTPDTLEPSATEETPKTVDLPNDTGGDPDATSSRIDGDRETKKKCGVINIGPTKSGLASWFWIFILLPLVMAGRQLLLSSRG